MKNAYSPSEIFKNCYSLLCTKLFFKGARLVRRPVYLRGAKGLAFGKGFTTGYRCRFDIDMEKEGVKLRLGKNCKIGDNVHFVARNSVTFGDDCLLASNVFISDTEHGDITDSPLTIPDERKLHSNPVSIGNCVWIGEGVAVLSGAVIGDGCIIGAHSVVKGEIPPYSVAVGAPARVVKKYNFETKVWERI